MIKRKYKNLSVDAGNITAILKSKIKVGEFDSKDTKQIRLKKGKYRVTLSCKNCWNGEVSFSEFVNVKDEKDTFLVGDACYYITQEDDAWGWYLSDTDYGADLYGIGCALNTGGDGGFDIEVLIEELNYRPVNKYKKMIEEANAFYKKANRLRNVEKIEDAVKEFKEKFFMSKKYKNVYSQEVELMCSKLESNMSRRAVKQFREYMAKLM